MDLNNYQQFSKIDSENLLGHINNLPNQLIHGFEMGLSYPLPETSEFNSAIIIGMGGSAIAADLLSAYVKPTCPIPLVVYRDYSLPGWCRGEKTLAVLCSHSGNTEETLSAFEQAVNHGCTTIAITTGGKLTEIANSHNIPIWHYHYQSQPRAAVGYSFSLLLALFTRLGLHTDSEKELVDTVSTMQEAQSNYHIEIPTAKNPAKRMAGQLIDRCVCVIGSGIMIPVARRWKTQINELSKAWAQFEELPEADHNTLAGCENPSGLISRQVLLFLRADSEPERMLQRIELTKTIFMLQGLGTDFIDATGNTRLAQQWSMLHFGDYLAYYLAMAYDIDPTPIQAIEDFKKELDSL